ncbi:AsnC family transcriptional regulator [archaeon SCG-AAA382B04]|nr:AsnC family transcriptional regulator [archaeon SCG-AAA382B04]
MKLDKTDKKILKQLQKDARKSYSDIAEAVDVAEGTVYNRIEKLKEEKILKGFVADIDYSKLGYDIIAIIGVTSKGGKLPGLEQKIAKNGNVTSVYDVTGDYDAMVVAKFKERDHLNQFVKELLSRDDVVRTNTMVVLNTVKETHSINLNQQKNKK